MVRNLDIIRARKSYWRVLISGFLLVFPKIPSDTSTEILLMRKRERGQWERQAVMQKSLLTILTLPCWTSLYISILLGLSVQKLRRAPVCFTSFQVPEHWVVQALLKALLHSWEEAVWAGEQLLGLPLLSFEHCWKVIQCSVEGLTSVLMSKDRSQETEARVEAWSSTLFKTKFVFGSKSFCSSL